MKLRDYQTRLVAAIREHWDAGRRRVLAVLPTGGGKTETAIDIIRDEATPTTRVLIIAERKQLAVQWVARLKRHGFDYVGLLQADNTIRLAAPIIVATAQSLRSRGCPEGVALIVIDESHIWHRTHDDVLDRLPDARVLGLTATPLREGLGLRFDALAVGSTIAELQAEGSLVRARYYAPAQDEIERALQVVAIQAGDYHGAQLSKTMRQKAIIGDVVSTWQRLGEDRQTIAFCVDKQHARDLADEFQSAGVAAEVMLDDTSDEDRAELIADFEAKRLRILVSVGVLSIGFDSPIASCAIMARPTLSLGLYIQQGGRVLRPYPGKTDAIVLDHAGNVLRHGKLEDFEPPADLSKIDKGTDKKSRRDPAKAWVCRSCHALNDLADDICTECGTACYRRTLAVVVDGELRPFDVERPGDPLPGATLDEVHRFYQSCRWHGRSRGMRSPDGWAYYATIRRYGLRDGSAKLLLPYSLRAQQPIPPDDATARWLRADLQRARVAARYRARGAA